MNGSVEIKSSTRRWSLLRSSLVSLSKVPAPCSDPSLFQLGKFTPYYKDGVITYSLADFDPNTTVSLQIKLDPPRLDLNDFKQGYSGFLNTGNIRVWPSEEILAVECGRVWCKESLVSTCFKHQRIIELGAGQCGLAGLVLASLVECEVVHLTDGNPKSVAKLQENVLRNQEHLKCPVEAYTLLWESPVQQQQDPFDVILVSDCTFDTNAHLPLLSTLKRLLKPSPDSTILLMAPCRGTSLSLFLQTVDQDTDCTTLCYDAYPLYNPTIYQQHQDKLLLSDYEADKMYPHLYVLRWKN